MQCNIQSDAGECSKRKNLWKLQKNEKNAGYSDFRKEVQCYLWEFPYCSKLILTVRNRKAGNSTYTATEAAAATTTKKNRNQNSILESESLHNTVTC